MRIRAASVVTATGCLLLLVAAPAVLVHVVDWPSARLPSTVALRDWLRRPLTPGFLTGVALAGAGLLWALLAVAVAARAYSRVVAAWRWLPAVRLPGPLQGLTAALLGATAVSAGTSGTPAHAATPTTAEDVAPLRQPAAATGAAPATTLATEAAGGASEPIDTYTVRRGDTLSTIAKRCLGDPDRWPEIFALNRGTHFPDVGGALRNPNLIYPGWTLHLPAGATPRGRQPRPPADVAPPASRVDADPSPYGPGKVPSLPTPAATTSGRQQPPSPTAPAATAAPDSGTPAVPATPAADTARPATDTSPTAERTSRGMCLPSGSWIDLGLAFAIAAAVALVWAHRQRRYVPRRPSTGSRPDDATLAPMPRVVRQIRRGLHRTATGRPDPYEPAHPADPDEPGLDDEHQLAARGSGAAELDDADLDHDDALLADVAAANLSPVPGLDNRLSALWPPAGLGLTGPGAEAAARGFLTAALASGGVEHPDARVEVIIPAATTATLLDAAAVALPRTPRLTVTANLGDALDILETQTMHRSRLVYRHDVDTVAELRRADPFEEPLPPVLLVADVSSNHERARVAALLAQGHRLDIHGVLLGDWPDGTTVAVAADGATTPANGDHTQLADVDRLAVLNPAEAIDLLGVLAESHTGLPPTPAPTEPTPAAPVEASGSPTPVGTTHTPQPQRRAIPTCHGVTGTTDGHQARADDTRGADAMSAQASESSTFSMATDAVTQPTVPGEEATSNARRRAPAGDDTDDGKPARVRVRVLGTPGVVDSDPQRTPRAKSLELLVYLAVHDGAASTETILDDLLPDAPSSKAPARLYTYVSGLRAVLRQAGGPGEHVTHPDHRYLLNADLLDVDLWRMRAAIRDAAQATDPQARAAALRRAVDAYTGPLADGRDYEWVEPYREAIRQEALDAHLALADALTGQPTQQLEVLDAAIGHNPHHEALYQAAMRARAGLGDTGGIRALRRALTRRLAEIDAEPGDDTLALADRLVTDLRQHGRALSARRHPHASRGAQ